MANKNTGRVVVTGAGGFIGHHLGELLEIAGTLGSRRGH